MNTETQSQATKKKLDTKVWDNEMYCNNSESNCKLGRVFDVWHDNNDTDTHVVTRRGKENV